MSALTRVGESGLEKPGRPMRVTARLQGAIANQSKALMLDALLMSLAAAKLGLPPPPPLRDIEIPLDLRDGLHLCTSAMCRDEEHELRWKNRRAPIPEMQLLGDSKLRRVNLTGGANRSYRIPLDTVHLELDQMVWWAQGDIEAVRELLDVYGGYLGHRRAVGLGRVREWTVTECTPDELATWGPGFPVLRDGFPTRPLPLDWPGLSKDAAQDVRCVRPPYWRRAEEELCAVPSWT